MGGEFLFPPVAPDDKDNQKNPLEIAANLLIGLNDGTSPVDSHKWGSYKGDIVLESIHAFGASTWNFEDFFMSNWQRISR